MSEKKTPSIGAAEEEKNVYNEPSNAIELKYLHIPIECNVLANRDDKEVFFPSSLFLSLSRISRPLFINGMGIWCD